VYFVVFVVLFVVLCIFWAGVLVGARVCCGGVVLFGNWVFCVIRKMGGEGLEKVWKLTKISQFS